MGELFGDRLKKIRKECGLTQTQLSEKLNVHLQTVSKWERNISEPDFSVLGDLADALQIPLEKLLGCEENDELYRGNFDAVLFGKAISFARKGKGESQENLAEQLGVSADTVSKWERGVVCPNIDQLKGLCENFGVSVSKLYFGITGEQETQTVQQVQRRKKFSLLSLLAAVIFCAGVVFLSVYLTNFNTGIEKPVYTVSVDGQEYEVEEGGWFSPPVPQRDGYDFIGFEGADHTVVQFPQKITGDVFYNAVFEPHEYTIDYWLNGGGFQNDAVGSFTVESGVVELPEPVKSGATFEGWFFASDYSGEEVQRISCDCRDVVLYAKWSDNTFTVRYDLCGGILSESNPETVTAEREETLSEPVRKGYDFLGWFDAPTGGNMYETVGGSNAKNLVLYAHWQENDNTYPVNYHLNGGTLLQSNPEFVGAGEVHELHSPEKFGYDFIGWNTSANGDGEYYERLYGIRGELTLYAIYSPKTYTIRYELDGGTYYDGVNPNKISYGETVELLPLAKYGYAFAGWFDAETDGNKVEKIDKTNVTQLTVLYARFSILSFRLKLDAGDGAFRLNNIFYKTYAKVLNFGEPFDLPECVLAGYEFVGWADEEGELVEKIDEWNIENISLKAQYREAEQTYKITYDLDGGTQNAENTEIIAFGQEIPLKEPTKEGYSFLGWNDRSDGSGNYYDCTQKDWESDRALYAIWQEITVSGSKDNFTYEKGVKTVKITGYTGPFGEDLDLVFPTFIDGLPVTEVEGNFSRYTESSFKYPYLRSLVLPQYVNRLGDKSFTNMNIERAVTIPASVEFIGKYCFSLTDLSVEFEEGSRLKSIQPYAFSGARFHNPVYLPYGVERVEEFAFCQSINYSDTSVILPKTVRYIEGWGLDLETSSSALRARVYIPESVEYIERGGIGRQTIVYTALSKEKLNGFANEWNWNLDQQVFITETGISGVTLRDGDKETFMSGKVFVLPEPSKEGYNFIGWKETDGDFVSPFYIPLKDGIVLESAYEPKTASDGRTLETAMTLECGQRYEIMLKPNEYFYFKVNKQSGKISFSMQSQILGSPNLSLRTFIYRVGETVPLDDNHSIPIEKDDVFMIHGHDYLRYHYRVWITVNDTL